MTFSNRAGGVFDRLFDHPDSQDLIEDLGLPAICRIDQIQRNTRAAMFGKGCGYHTVFIGPVSGRHHGRSADVQRQRGAAGDAAPAFKEASTSGKSVSLSDFKGKTVILEWTNNGCPFVQKHCNSQNMQKTQAAATGGGRRPGCR